MERVLITGGSGFIGACLAHDLIAAGHEVHLLLRQESRTWRLAALEGRYISHWADLRDGQLVRAAMAACRPDVIYHLAAHGAYRRQKERAAILATNLLGTANLLDALDGHDYRMLVQAGSSSEYGHKNGPIRETDRLEPRDDYGVTKAAATLLCQAEAFKGRPVTTVRVFSAYGPWDDPARLVPYVINCCARGDRPQLTTGHQPRDFIYIDDVVDLLKTAARLPQARGEILHAGTGRQHSVRDMVQTIMTVCGGGKMRAEFGNRIGTDEPATWVASIEHTTAVTGWKPRCDLRTGVERTWTWLQSRGAWDVRGGATPHAPCCTLRASRGVVHVN
jgi:nucleoside-diphosphate-sugar epimerase